MPKRADRFFAWVWRVNGVLLLVLGVLGVVGLASLVFGTTFFPRHDPEQQLTSVAAAELREQASMKRYEIRWTAFDPVRGGEMAKTPWRRVWPR